MKRASPWIVVVGAVAVTTLYLYQFANGPLTFKGSTKRVEFEIVKGMHPHEISENLEKQGIIPNANTFYWIGKLTQGWSGIKAADYELVSPLSPLQIFKIFKSGIGIQHGLLVREGDNIYQVAETFETQGLSDSKTALKLLRSQELIASLGLRNEGIRSLEGYLFPNTYFFDKRDQPVSVIKRMVEAFLRSWSSTYETRAKEIGLSRRQVVTLASIVEKETGASEERPLVASVFWNRLKKKMRLQSDPTTIYGIWEHYDGNIHRSDLHRPTEYNTYTVPALPIGPISNPNPESIKAVLYPAETDYLYFVSHNDGTHQFSKTYGEHNAWVKKTQLDPGARDGKSWRDLSKKK